MNIKEINKYMGKNITFFCNEIHRIQGKVTSINQHINTITIEELGHKRTFEMNKIDDFDCIDWAQ